MEISNIGKNLDNFTQSLEDLLIPIGGIAGASVLSKIEDKNPVDIAKKIIIDIPKEIHLGWDNDEEYTEQDNEEDTEQENNKENTEQENK